jgi:DNA-binding MarR family transcriptional regulator
VPSDGQTPWLNEGEQRVWRTLIVATGSLMASLDAELQADHNMSLAEYEVLVGLSEAPNRAMRMSDLAAVLHLSPSGLTRRLDALVRRGWVRREKCGSDRRGSFAVLTDEGFTRLENAAPTHVRGVREHFLSHLSARQLADLGSALDAVMPEQPMGSCSDHVKATPAEIAEVRRASRR